MESRSPRESDIRIPHHKNQVPAQARKDFSNQNVRSPYLQRQNRDGCYDDREAEREIRREHSDSSGHAADIGSRFDSVADDHADESALKHPSWVVVTDDVEEALARNLAQR